MNKAFIFDMDGVIVASEEPWHRYLEEIWSDLVGKDVAIQFKIPVGMTPKGIYEEAIKHGSVVSEAYFLQTLNEIAVKVYLEAKITPNLNALGEYLVENDFKIGLVSSSRMDWIETVLKRLSFSSKIECVISINDRPDLKPKPAPDGYLEAIDKLGSQPDSTIILEDSNSGITAAKESGAYTIGLTSNLIPNYDQQGADDYASTVEEVIKIIEGLNIKLS